MDVAEDDHSELDRELLGNQNSIKRDGEGLFTPKKLGSKKLDARDDMIRVQDDYESDAPIHIGPKG